MQQDTCIQWSVYLRDGYSLIFFPDYACMVVLLQDCGIALTILGAVYPVFIPLLLYDGLIFIAALGKRGDIIFSALLYAKAVALIVAA